MFFFRTFLIILLFPVLALSEEKPDCDNSCNNTPSIEKISFQPPNYSIQYGIMTIKGNGFPNCRENASVTFGGETLEIVSSTENEIISKIEIEEYLSGSYKIQVSSTRCPNKYDIFYASIPSETKPITINDFTMRKTMQVVIYPYSYADVTVTCNEDEKAISGGFLFSTWEVKIVSSFPEGRNWQFKVYNNEAIVSQLNEFYAICVR